ncbi:MAG: hypothetical protein CVU64_21795 [Deltaproteobacteria bacterium HGW-Deltaproteobacteria-21]|nr:MAG: hypothetical protein CVU64_21795 [Deltaproteobacteria bacterium HGW-Deltaproteobacteria-21]
MFRSLFLSFSLLLAIGAPLPMMAQAAEPIDAGIQIMAYGYELKVAVNGVDLGLKGGRSEGIRIKDKAHPWKEKMAGQPKERIERIFVLNPGKNTLQISYRKTSQEPSDELEFTLFLEPESSDKPVFLIQDVLKDSSGQISKDFEIPTGDLSKVKPVKLR